MIKKDLRTAHRHFHGGEQGTIRYAHESFAERGAMLEVAWDDAPNETTPVFLNEIDIAPFAWFI